MANPFPFTAGQVLTADQMNGIGEVVSFTPTWTGLTVGNGTQAFRYLRINGLVHVQGKLTLGSTSSVNGTTYFNVPIATANQQQPSNVGNVWFNDSGTGYLYGNVILESSVLVIRAINTAGTYAAPTDLTPTVPFTWAVNDTISVSLTYEI